MALSILTNVASLNAQRNLNSTQEALGASISRLSSGLRINKAGVGILMVEQNARQALAFASKGFVLANGQNRFTGTGAELIADPEVAKSFLGG